MDGARFTVVLSLLGALALPVAAGDFDEAPLAFSGCAGVEDGRLVLSTCYAPEDTCSYSMARMLTFVPGTLQFDLTWDVTGVKEYSQFLVTNGGPNWLFVQQAPLFEDAWCQPVPCGGQVLDIAVPVEAGGWLDFTLTNNGEPCLPGDDGLRCIVDNLRFTPTPGIHELGFGLDAAPLFDSVLPVDPLLWFVGDVVSLDDLDGDGVRDVALGIPAGSQAGTDGGQVRVLSGRTGETLFVHTGEALGFALDHAGDLDGDGLGDLLAGDPSQGISHVNVWSGATGALLLQLDGAEDDGFGDAVAGLGDIDGDGIGDLCLGLPYDDTNGFRAGALRVISGQTQAVLFSHVGDAATDELGRRVVGPGDVNGDGVPDFAASAPRSDLGGSNAGVVRVWSGADGSLLHEFLGNPNDVFGDRLERVGDFDADGFADVLMAAPQASDWPSHGRLELRSGADGSLLLGRKGTHPFQPLGSVLAGVGDVDADGTDDVAVTDFGNERILVFGGPDGQLLLELRSDTFMEFGQRLAGLDDVDGDGGADLFVVGQGLFQQSTALGVSSQPSLQGAPRLMGFGVPTPQGALRLALADGPARALTVFVLGLSALDAAPFKAGVLLPTPDLVIAGPPLDSDGALLLPLDWPASLAPPSSLVVQVWIPDDAAASGWTATNALALNAQ